MSFREIAVTIRAVNHASAEFNRIQTDAESLATRVKSLGAAIAGIGATGMAVGYIANQFGLLNDAQARTFQLGDDGCVGHGHVHAHQRGLSRSTEGLRRRNRVRHRGSEQLEHQLRHVPRVNGRRHRRHRRGGSGYAKLREQYESGNHQRPKLQRHHGRHADASTQHHAVG